MRHSLALVTCIGLAGLAAAQQRSTIEQKGAPATLLGSTPRPSNKPFIPPVISSTTSGLSTTLVLDISGTQSWDSLSDVSNTTILVPLPVGDNMTGIGWDVNLATIGASWRCEAVFYFDGSDQDLSGLFLTPGFADCSPGASFYSSPVIDLTDNAIPDIPILGDGLLWVQLFESFDDVGNAADADWVSPSTLTIVYETPPPPPAPRVPVFVEDFESGFPPAGWSSVDNIGFGDDWDLQSAFGRGNLTNGTGECASLDSDFYGPASSQDAELIIDAFTLPSFPCALEFDSHYNDFDTLDSGAVDINVNGAGWVNLATYTVDHDAYQSINLTAYAGSSNVQIRFHYVGTFGWWWQVDNVGVFSLTDASFRNSGTNPASYTVTATPVPGEDFVGEVDLTTTGHTSAYLVGYMLPDTFVLTGGQTVLVDLNSSQAFFSGPLGGPTATFTLGVPADISLYGFTGSSQAVHIGGVVPFALSNAQDLTIGNPVL